ncbi:hypothetical protein IJT17_06430 [bacterium]|nr:hypothetical protein [bacterium]
MLYIVVLALVLLLWGTVYALPRLNRIRTLEAESQGYVRQRQEIANSIEALKRSRKDLPTPEPNTVSWLAAHGLSGIEKNLEANNPYNNGLGAQLKLRNIDERAIVKLLKKLCTVNLIIKSFKLEDADGDGRWNLEMMVEVPL